MANHDVAIDDLYAVSAAFGPEKFTQAGDGEHTHIPPLPVVIGATNLRDCFVMAVHYVEEGSQALADQAATSILQALAGVDLSHSGCKSSNH